MYLYEMILQREILLGDLFMLLFMQKSSPWLGLSIALTGYLLLFVIVAITALCRLIIMQTKEMDAIMVMWEAGAIFILAGSAYLMSLKDKISLEKLKQSKE